ncbi:hypothetical protein [Photobacterium sp. GSS17]|uniref:hypothetical protein n=1 Tax=Photobacterium sp. GSS17 TaxID=3020715 RepID=UPI002360F4BE|nr:hypothetical protein [Photobacterium sp. GSS17]
MTSEKQKEQTRKRQQALRDRRKALGQKTVSSVLSNKEFEMLTEICAFFAPPGQPLTEDEAVSSMINRFHSFIPALRVTLGKCDKCSRELPTGCDGFFKGDTQCWHTLNRIQLHQLTRPKDFVRTIKLET